MNSVNHNSSIPTTNPQSPTPEAIDSPHAPPTPGVPIEIDLQPLAPSSPHPPKPTKSLSREQILRATIECFDEKGYDGATIRAIAAKLSCAVGSIYRYFKDKHKLLLACAESTINPVVNALADPAETVELSMQRYRLQAKTHPQLYHLLFWLASIDNHNNALPAPIQNIINAWATRLDSAEQAQQLWINLHGQIIFGLHTDHPINIPTPNPNHIEMIGLNPHHPQQTQPTTPQQTEPQPEPEPAPAPIIQIPQQSPIHVAIEDDMTLL